MGLIGIYNGIDGLEFSGIYLLGFCSRFKLDLEFDFLFFSTSLHNLDLELLRVILGLESCFRIKEGERCFGESVLILFASIFIFLFLLSRSNLISFSTFIKINK